MKTSSKRVWGVLRIRRRSAMKCWPALLALVGLTLQGCVTTKVSSAPRVQPKFDYTPPTTAPPASAEPRCRSAGRSARR